MELNTLTSWTYSELLILFPCEKEVSMDEKELREEAYDQYITDGKKSLFYDAKGYQFMKGVSN